MANASASSVDTAMSLAAASDELPSNAGNACLIEANDSGC
jgi:hypothetical protein